MEHGGKWYGDNFKLAHIRTLTTLIEYMPTKVQNVSERIEQWPLQESEMREETQGLMHYLNFSQEICIVFRIIYPNKLLRN